MAARRSVAAALAVGGIAGPLAFTVLVIAQGLSYPEYSHMALPISALAAWPGGWVQSLNFVILGVLMSAFAIGIHLAVRPGPGGVTGPALLVLSGMGLVLAGVFPWRAAAGDFVVPPGHLAGALLSFLGAGSGFIALSRRMSADPHWRSLAGYALATGIVMLVLFFTLFGFARSPAAPLYPWAGLLQRAAVGVWFACTIVLALRLRRTMGAADAAH